MNPLSHANHSGSRFADHPCQTRLKRAKHRQREKEKRAEAREGAASGMGLPSMDEGRRIADTLFARHVRSHASVRILLSTTQICIFLDLSPLFRL